MQPANIDSVQTSFSLQAAGFERAEAGLSSAEWLDRARRAIAPSAKDRVLEVCSGTCLMGRSLAPYVSHVTCIDATPAMLAEGKRLAAKADLTNMEFQEGLAEELPYPDGTFDIVVTRLSFHHLVDAGDVFHEMERVLAPDGKLVVADMLSAPEPLRDVRDSIEKMRDPSHERCFSQEELERFFHESGLHIQEERISHLPHALSGWMDLTHTPQATQAEIERLMKDELRGGKKTGFAPYRNSEGDIWFDQAWLLIVGTR
ncbi:MAG: class I SAM-dependent methyltransferase [Atopobiaceae bacterium]|nr:class I SAM-dependent methyltransferase [Atopobiaceae bacterium]